jgi:hypothetical protein
MASLPAISTLASSLVWFRVVTMMYICFLVELTWISALYVFFKLYLKSKVIPLSHIDFQSEFHSIRMEKERMEAEHFMEYKKKSFVHRLVNMFWDFQVSQAHDRGIAACASSRKWRGGITACARSKTLRNSRIWRAWGCFDRQSRGSATACCWLSFVTSRVWDWRISRKEQINYLGTRKEVVHLPCCSWERPTWTGWCPGAVC